MENLLLLGWTIAASVAAAYVAGWIADPIESLARSRRAPTQFTVCDLLILFAWLQLAVGTVHYLMTHGEEPGAVNTLRDSVLLMDGSAATFITMCWWCGTSMVSRAGIGHWWHRAVILGFVVPCGILGSLAMVAVLAGGIPAILFGPPSAVSVLVVVAAVVVVVLIHVCGMLARWVAAKYPPRQSAEQANQQDGASSHAASEET